MPRHVKAALKLLALGLALGCGLWAVQSQFPAHRDLFPKCLFFQLTGLHCPGCGSTRALHYLLCGDIGRTLHNNVLIVLLLPLIATWLYQQARRWVWGTPPSEFWDSSPLLYWLGIAIMVYFVLRNLPWWPFCLLAPLPE